MRAILAVALALAAAKAEAGFHFGLGNAVAKASKDIAERSLGPSDRPCGPGTEFFSVAPVSDPALVALTPLGNLNPSGHTLPTDHMYFNYSVTGASATVALYSPGDGDITRAVQTSYLTGFRAGTQDYSLTVSPCREVELTFAHVRSVSPALLGPLSFSQCSGYTTGSETVQQCQSQLDAPVHVAAGQLLGNGVGDFGPLNDSRSPMGGFANPSRHRLTSGLCPLNYFQTAARTAMLAITGHWTGSTLVPRVITPVCGSIMQDVPGTAQGDWYNPSQPTNPEDPHLALVHDPVFPSTAAFSVGTSASASGLGGPQILFFPKTTPDGSRINYDFNLVTNDGNIYCFDSFHPFADNAATFQDGRVILLQMTGTASLSIERQGNGTSSTCASLAPWSFTAAKTDFVR